MLKHISDQDIRFVEQTGQYLQLKYCILTQRQVRLFEFFQNGKLFQLLGCLILDAALYEI